MIMLCVVFFAFFFFKQKTAYEMRISDWSSDVCSSDLRPKPPMAAPHYPAAPCSKPSLHCGLPPPRPPDRHSQAHKDRTAGAGSSNAKSPSDQPHPRTQASPHFLPLDRQKLLAITYPPPNTPPARAARRTVSPPPRP